jgi:acyl-CoA synthetase (AMP-forming)/AMP-acid ligase II
MESNALPAELVAKINNARCLAERPVENRFATPATVAEMLHLRATTTPNAPYLTYLAEDGSVRSYTYASFYQQVRRLAEIMNVLANVTAGSRVATAMHNHDMSILINFAAWHLGATVVPLNMGEEDKRLQYVLEHSGARALFVLGEYAERMRPLFPTGPGVKNRTTFSIEAKNASKTDIPLEDFIGQYKGNRLSKPDAKPDNEALIVYTSGTTGVPKGVVLSQYALIADAYAITEWHGFSNKTKMMCVLPVHHVNGLEVTHVTPMYFGGSVVLTRKFSAREFFQQVAAHNIDVVSVVPTLLQFLIEATPKEFDKRKNAPTLQYVICGAGPLTVDLAARFEDRFDLPIVHGYGLSESTCYSCFVPVTRAGESGPAADAHRSWLRDYGYPSIGIPIATNAMAIHDDNGNELSEGAKGEIVIRGHNIMLGYHDNLKANENAFTHGWFRSGDEGFFKAGPKGEKYFFISGRFKELIIRGGVKLSPLEIDEVLNRIDGVKAGMAVGFENVTYGEEVGAYIVKKPGTELNEEAVIAACRKTLPFSMTPKVVVFGETFPVTSTGKYQRNQLKPLFEAHKNTQFRDEKK